MRTRFTPTISAMAIGGAGLLSLAGAPAVAAPGLTESVYHSIVSYSTDPSISIYDTDSDINLVEAYLATATPVYSFNNTADMFDYNFDTGYSVAAFLGADGASSSAVAGDTQGTNFFAVVASGVVTPSTPGNYTFSLPTADDAARVYVGGQLVAEQNYGDAVLATPSSGFVDLTGPESFELVYYQFGGNADLSYGVTGVGTVSYSTGGVPEPAPWAMMLVGVGLIGGATRRQARTSFAV
jgi:hypothetical protein